MFRILKVFGRSLEPFYQDGDFVLISRIPVSLRKLKPGDVVVFRHPVYGTMIKIVERLTPGQDEIYVVGLQAESVDSRHFGAVRREELLGKVLWHIGREPAVQV